MVVEGRNEPYQTFQYRWTHNGVFDNFWGDHGTISVPKGDQTIDGFRTGKLDKSDLSEGFTQVSGSQQEFLKELEEENSGDLGRSSAQSWTGRNLGTADNGHEFTSLRHSITWQPPVSMSRPTGPFGPVEYTGYCFPGFFQTTEYPTLSLPSTAAVNADGAKLMSMAMPTKPEAALAQFVGELREKLPELVGWSSVQERFGTHTLGDEHLNLQFGIKPFINDLQKMARGVLHASKLTRQFSRDSGKNVRRQRHLNSQAHSEELAPGGGITMALYGDNPFERYIYDLIPAASITQSTTSDVWFSGAFTYYLSQAHSFLGRMESWEQKANHLLGIRMNASTVWELTPWSWLIDWHSDIGSFLSNASMLSEDSLVLRYGYVMHDIRCVKQISVQGLVPADTASAPRTLTSFCETRSKTRVRATPYGFGLNLESLSPSRWAILGALGMTKSPGKLR